MDFYSVAGAPHCPPISSEKYNNEDDLMTKLLGFYENHASQVAQSSGAQKMDMKPWNNPLNSSGQYEEISKILNGSNFTQTFRKLMHMKKEADKLHEKLKLSEKEKADLQLKFDVLLAENYQIKHLKNEYEEINQKVNELQKDLSDKLKAQQKLKKDAESRCVQLSEKSKTIRKMKKDKKRLWKMFKRFAHKLENADGERKDHSFLANIQMSTDTKQNRDSVKNESRYPESNSCLPVHHKECDNQISEVRNAILFSQCSTPSPKTKFSSGTDYIMKSFREDPHVLNGSLDINISELQEIRKLLGISKDKVAPISPLSSTPHSSITKFRHGLLRKDLQVDNSVSTLPVHKSLGQTPKTSKSQGLLSINSPVPNSSRKLAFCHQQSEFDAVPEHSVQRLNSDIGNLNHSDLNVGSLSSSLQAPYKFSAKRCHDNTVKLNFHINNPISMTVNPNNWELSCILAPHEGRKSDASVTFQPKLKSTYVKTCESYNNNLMTSEENDPMTRKMSKVDQGSLSEVTVPVTERSDQSNFMSFRKPNIFKPNIVYPDVPANRNSINYSSKAMAIKKELPFDCSQSSTSAFGNAAPHQHFKNLMDDNRSVLSISCENLSCTKREELSSQEFSLPLCKSISIVSDAVSKELDNPSNDSVNIPVRSPSKASDQDISVKMPKGTFLNIPSSDHVANYEIDENLKMITEVLDSVLTCSTCNSTCCPIASSEQSVVLFPTSEVGGIWNNSEPVVVSNTCNASTTTNFPNNQIMEQKVDTSISGASDLFENQGTTEIPNTVLSKISSSVVTDNFLTNEVPASFVQESNISMGISVSILSLPPMSASKSPVKAKCSGFTSPTKNSAMIAKDFSEQLDIEPLVDKNNKSLQRGTCFDKKSSKYLVASHLIESSKSSILNNKEVYKSTSLQENSNNTKGVGNAETKLSKSFDKEEFIIAPFIDSLIKDKVQESDLETISNTETKERCSSNIGETMDNNLLDKTSITDAEDLQVSSWAAFYNTTPSATNPFIQTVSDISSLIYMMIDSVVADTEIKVETRESPPRARKIRQGIKVDSSRQTNKAKIKDFQSINLSTAKKSALLNGDETKHNILEIDSDTKSPLSGGDFKKVQPSILISEVRSVEQNTVHSEDNSINKTPTTKRQKNSPKTPKKSGNRIELSPIEAAFQEIEKIKFTTTAKLKLHVQNLVTVLSDPSISKSSQDLVFHLVKYLHNTRRNFMSNNADTLLPASEQCIVKALLAVDAKKFPHLGGLLPSAIETMYYLVLWKTQYHIYGLSSLCRVMTAICKELNDPSKPRLLCCDLLKYNHKFGPFLIAYIVSVYKEAFQRSPDTTEEEKIFLHALSYGVQQKSITLTNIQWKNCKKLFSKVFTLEGVNTSEEMPYLMNAIEDKCLSGAPYESGYMLIGPLVIYARVKGWIWAQEHLLEDYIYPNLQAYSGKENGERGFAFFTNLCADICYGCPDEGMSQRWLMNYIKTPCEREFVQINAGTALLKLISLRKEVFTDEIEEWISHFYGDPRVTAFCSLYFKLRLMEDQDLALENDIF
ncbi:hypothetical protein AVEN_141180-2 [Araneus ventricosus]|uniref:Uncharacterized protein n=1 Tax=Araneus ventricosus TaxID=182803 RepID=A0A4Y2EQI8_ARAVE|nr:hypothetical protein AVEN_141180-2 [Araneus ventricosus]